MKFKKLLVISILAVTASGVLTACGSKSNSKKEATKEINTSNLEGDAVSKKTKTVDGKEVTEYTMEDGNVVQIPTENKDKLASDDSSSNN
ncbi:ABC transporter [Streptococcus castoreus]|uniref:hypothetical protein n=1 Tax=Streptococcus castoreus TaxID=254786 RepID=UPI00040D8308|nr:hypothetical protein [Streptococcus castoreus]